MRTTRLEEFGFIKRYRAVVDINRLLQFDTVIVEVTLVSHSADVVSNFERKIYSVPEIVECFAIGGGFDYLLKFVVTDISHYQEVFNQLIQPTIGIDKYFSYIVTKSIKNCQDYPIELLLARQRSDRKPYE